jgi:hypothetical protein
MGSPKMRAKHHSHSAPLKPGTGRTPGRARRERFRRLQERLRDPLLRGLTILIALLMFVIAPLHAGGAIESQMSGLPSGWSLSAPSLSRLELPRLLS